MRAARIASTHRSKRRAAPAGNGACASAAVMRGEFAFDALVNCAGLGAQKVARAIEDYPGSRVPRLVMAKGNYFSYAGKPAFTRLIYPTPMPAGSACM